MAARWMETKIAQEKATAIVAVVHNATEIGLELYWNSTKAGVGISLTPAEAVELAAAFSRYAYAIEAAERKE